ncbi:hypothetical protein sos41_08370 [Alphaproteobacteria bacterium SO-S41]|nr:hypothetical protein sos41_08370 [Alphaproteobacteria bacterium SO-S41]
MAESHTSPGFAGFVDRLSDVLEARSVDARDLNVVFDPARRGGAAAHEVYVGIGAWLDRGEPVGHEGACLNNKSAGARFGWKRDPVTVASFVRDAPEAQIAAWRALFSDDPETALDRATLVVEDASPDSVLSVIFWLARLHGVPAAELPQRWITALTSWERDGVAPSVTQSWTALMSALAHSHFGGEGIAAAWGDALRFTASLLRYGVDPDAVSPEASPQILAEAAYGRAIAFAMNERQDYLQSLARAVRLELLVPMADSHGRLLLVDAYFAVESNAPSGVKKIYIRTDTENTSLGNGFSLMGLYRPGLVGTGNDMTVSVDPRSGIALKDLWTALEAMEIERWGGERPDGAPRRITSYPTGGYDQPWWDDHGRYTLLGAPKQIGNGVPGSRLTWSDVLEAVWRCYNQLRVLAVFDLGEEGGKPRPKPIEACAARRVASGSGEAEAVKYLIAAKWDRSEGHSQTLQFTGTVKRHLAALIEGAAAGRTGHVRLADLAEPEDFDYLEIAGGTAVVNRDGAFLLDDWRDKDLAIQALSADFAQAVALLSSCKTFDAEVDDLYAGSNAKEGLFSSNTGEILRRITLLRGRIAATFQRADLAEAAPERRAIRAALEHRWGLEGKEAALTSRLKDLQEILETKATLDTQGMATLIGFVSIPSFIGTVLQLYGSVVADQTDGAGPNYAIWIGALLIVLSLVFLVVAFLITRRRN